MSVACMSWVFAHSTAGGADRLLLLAIADHAGDDGGDAWPSVPTLARKTGTSERSVQRGITRLEADGHLVVQRGAGRGGTNLYRVVMTPPPGGDRLTPPPPPDAGQEGCQDVTGDDLTPVTEPRHQGGDTQVSPERPRTSFSPLPPTQTAAAPTVQALNSRTAGTNPRALRVTAEATQRRQTYTASLITRWQAIEACGSCDAGGYLPGGRVCDHDPSTPERAARGLALIRAELAARTDGGRR